jgi:hypothetical protein
MRATIAGAVAVAVVAAGVTVTVVRLEGNGHSVQAPVNGRLGGSVDMDSARLSVPPGSVSGSGHLVASTGGAPSASSGLASGLALANSLAPVHFQVTSARLTGPVEVTFRVGAADAANAIWLAYYDPALRQWQPVPSRYDPRTGTVTAEVRHLSWWAPWTWDWQGFALRLRQTLSAFASGRAPAVSCPGVPKVTVTSAGGQDPPLLGCAAKRGATTLTVSITDNRGVSVVMSGVPPDATQDPPSYKGFDEYIATRFATRQILGGADLAPSQTLTYSVPLNGPTEVFTAAPTVKSYVLDLASVVGNSLVGAAQFGKLSGDYATCILNAVAGSAPASFADAPGVAVTCLPALEKAIPALKGLASTEAALLQADAILILQDYDLANDAIHGLTGGINIARPPIPVVTASLPVVSCPTSSGADLPAVSLPQSRPVAVPQALAGDLSLYADDQGVMELLGPKGWSCTAAIGADGSGGVTVYPAGAGPSSAVAIAGSETSACVGCTLAQACPLFPSAATVLRSDLGQACPARPAAETVTSIAAGIMSFEDPPGVKGDGHPSGGPYPANGVMTYHPSAQDGSWQETCTLPASEKDICTAALDTFVSSYGQR